MRSEPGMQVPPSILGPTYHYRSSVYTLGFGNILIDWPGFEPIAQIRARKCSVLLASLVLAKSTFLGAQSVYITVS